MFCGSQSGDVLHVDLASKVRPTDVALGQNNPNPNPNPNPKPNPNPSPNPNP